MRGSPQVCRHRTQGGGHLPGERLQVGGDMREVALVHGALPLSMCTSSLR